MRGATRPRFTLKMLRDLRLPVPPIGDQRRISARLKERTTEAAKARAAAEAQLAGLDALQAALLREVFCGSAASEWPVSALGDVCEIQLGKMLSPASKKGISPKPYLRNTNVQWTRFDLRDVATMDFDEDEQRKFRLRPRDLLVCEGGEPGRAAVWAGEITECYYQKALHRLRPRGNAIDPYFVLYRLRLGGLTGEFTESHAKSTIAHLPAVRLAQLSINLPRLAEQQRIADRLREQFVEIERARAAAKSQLKTIAALPGAYLREAFAVNV